MLENTFDELLIKSGGIIDNFIFVCSSEFKSDLKEYKGIQITYLNIAPKGFIGYCPSIYYNDYLKQ